MSVSKYLENQFQCKSVRRCFYSKCFYRYRSILLAVMLMGNRVISLRGQKEKADFAEQVQVQILDMTILKLFEEISTHLQTSAKGHLPLYIEEREGKKSLIMYIFHSQDTEDGFTGLLKCTLFNERGVLKLVQENENHKKEKLKCSA